MKKYFIFPTTLIGIAMLYLAVSLPAEAKQIPLTPIEKLGKMLFLDKALSANGNQSCASCHAAEFGFTGPKGYINEGGAVYEGSIPGSFGDRKPPSAAYGGESPLLSYDEVRGAWVGGMFWDGRTTGWTLGDPLAEQAKGPFLNPMEQALPDAQSLCLKVSEANYAKLFKQVWGSFDCSTPEAVAAVYDQIGSSISAYEKSSEVNPFSSKFDLFWENAKAKGLIVKEIDINNWRDYQKLGLSAAEVYGLALFNDEGKGKCAFCHTLDEGMAGYPLFTDFTYDNLGIPKNPYNLYYNDNTDAFDKGLGGYLGDEAEYGKFKVPTLRNVDKRNGVTVKAYGHNGYFKSLEEIVHFYNTRDVMPWPAPEYADTINFAELGDLGLTGAEEDALVLFMQTLTDK